MASRSGGTSRLSAMLLVSVLQVLFLVALVRADISDAPVTQRELKGYWPLHDCEQCGNRKVQDYKKIYASAGQVDNNPDEEDIEIIATYSDASGNIQINSVRSKYLSASWVWENPTDKRHNDFNVVQAREDSFQHVMSGMDDRSELSTDEHQFKDGGMQYQPTITMNPIKLQRQKLRQTRRELRTAELIHQNKESEKQMQAAAIEQSKQLNTTVKGRYSIWRREYESPNSDSTLKLMRDQIIMAKAYASIALSKKDHGLYESLMKHIKDNQRAIGEANSDAELHPSALDRAKDMGHVLSTAKDQLYNCVVVARKLRAMLQSTEESINALKRKSAFLIQLAAKIVPKPLHCLPLQLTTDYFMQNHRNKGAVETCKESFHRFDKYLNFSNPKISENFDPNACGWAFGMNIFDLKEWKKRDITGIYHHWQDMNEDRTLWKLGTLPPGLITFYNLTYPLDRSWHVLGLGYDPALNQTEIDNAAVVHYNGNYKPWLDLAVTKYKSYWSRYVMYDNPYLQRCNINE
ncbi:PREDICTED: probable galacturonosyltransferase 3 [Nelumbo nucifera]|uniref:Hexosyltransferase n=1 Tax=Nelumbo nucifera TaxID=4432 RepID=A0A1U8ATY8_NELNU|nr:PREDICTED: probable galacturonosyltransferase 3 [Nelumbo nucifera]